MPIFRKRQATIGTGARPLMTRPHPDEPGVYQEAEVHGDYAVLR